MTEVSMQTITIRIMCTMMMTTLLSQPSSASDIGRRFPSEMHTFVDRVTGLPITALTHSASTDDKFYQTHPHWTLDESHIIFVSYRGASGKRQCFAVDAVTGVIVQLTEGPGRVSGHGFASRKRDLFYYIRNRDQKSVHSLIELDVGGILRDSRAGKMRQPEEYERVIASLPPGTRTIGGVTVDASESHAYIGLEWHEDGKKHWGLRSVDLQSGEMAHVRDMPFKISHIQANPEVSGEIMYCDSTGDNVTSQRMWLVNADGTGNRPLYQQDPAEWVTHEVWVDKDHVLFLVIGKTNQQRQKATGVFSINVRSGQVKVLSQVDKGGGHWHVDGTSDGRWAVADNFARDLYLVDRRSGRRTLLVTGYKPDKTHPHARDRKSVV